jgi:hypothetical protein
MRAYDQWLCDKSTQREGWADSCVMRQARDDKHGRRSPSEAGKPLRINPLAKGRRLARQCLCDREVSHRAGFLEPVHQLCTSRPAAVSRRSDEADGSPVYTNAGHLGENQGMRILFLFLSLRRGRGARRFVAAGSKRATPCRWRGAWVVYGSLDGRSRGPGTWHGVAAVRDLQGHVPRSGSEQAPHPDPRANRPGHCHAPQFSPVPRSCGGAGPPSSCGASCRSLAMVERYVRESV